MSYHKVIYEKLFPYAPYLNERIGIEILVETGQSHYDSGDAYYGTRTVFTCALTTQKMFSYIAERKGLPIIKEADNIRMPLECDKYQDKNDWGIPEIGDINNNPFD